MANLGGGVRSKAVPGDGEGTEGMPVPSQAIWTQAGDKRSHSISAYQNGPEPFMALHGFILPQG